MRHRTLRERNGARRSIPLLCAAGVLAGAPALAVAQDEPAPPAPPAPPAAPLPAPGDPGRDFDEARREFEAAQREFEAATREAARERENAAREAARERELAVQRGNTARATAQRERQAAFEESRGELERARRELEAARRNLEEAAREVARLSARAVAPIVEDFQVQWLGAGQGAMLGVVVEDDAEGARVTAVSPGGPADEAGVETGDVIVSVDGRALDENGRGPSRVLIERLRDVEPGDTVSLSIVRDGETRSIDVETREGAPRVFAFEGPRVQVLTDFFRPDRWSSMELVSLTPELGAYFGTERGLLVVRAPDDESLMLEDGDVILDINGRVPNSPEHAMKILGTFEAGETIELNIMRHQQQMTLEIPVEDRASGRSRWNDGRSNGGSV